MKTIELHSKKHPNLYTKVSDCDYEWLRQWKWGLSFLHKTNYYATRQYTYENKFHTRRMAREIMQAPKGMVVDHINHDTLDNQRENLRLCTHRQNMMNSKMNKKNKSGMIGVYWHTAARKWAPCISICNKILHLGMFDCPLLAQMARKEAEKKYYGEFAYVNNRT